MRIPDRIAAGAAALCLFFMYYRANTGNAGLSAAAAAVSALLLAGAWRYWKKRPKSVMAQTARAAVPRAKQALRELTLCKNAEAVAAIRAILTESYALGDAVSREDGFLCREEGRLLWIAVLARHPEAGRVTAADLAAAARRQREEAADACVLCALCPAGKPPADSALRAVRVLDIEALAQLWARSGAAFPREEPRRERRLGRLLRALVSPAAPGERARCLGYGAFLLAGWGLSRSPVLLACAIVQLARGLRGVLASMKKAPVRLCG